MKCNLSVLIGFVAYLVGTSVLAQDSFDSDNDGFDDNSDNCTLVFNPDQRDTNEDGYGNICDPDLDDDATITSADLGIMQSVFFTNNPDADLNGDDGVNFIDLGILKSRFFGVPGPTGTDPNTPNCNCAFSNDCLPGNFCDFGPGGFTVESNCFWRTPMPNGSPGTGCFTEYEGPPGGAICQGYCTVSAKGSAIGDESADVVIAGLGFWADALLRPSVAGGGKVDTLAARAAKNLDYVGGNAAIRLGRHVADFLSVASGLGFYSYFHAYETNPTASGEFIDIENDVCRINSTRLAIKALQAEIREGGSGAGHVLAIADHCLAEDWQALFTPRCESGPDALECFSDVVAEMAEFMSTPKMTAPASTRSFLDNLRVRQ